MKKRLKAFTLIELTIVVLIMALSMTIVLPRLNAGSDQLSLLRTSVKRIAGIAEYAQQKAAISHLTHYLNIDLEKGMYWVTSKGHDGIDTLVKSQFNLSGTLPDGIKFADVKLRGNDTYFLGNTIAIGFSPQGWADPAEISMTCATGEAINIVIEEFSGQIETYVAKEMN